MSNSNHTRGGFLPLGVSRKKDTVPVPGPSPGLGSNGFKRPPKLARPVQSTSKQEAAARQLAGLKKGSDNRVLAGYMAHEFLNKGTILGQKYDPARAEAAPVAGGKAREEKKKAAVGASSSSSSSGGNAKPNQVKRHEGYPEVANLLKRDGTHIPGIVNPTQLAQWLQHI